MGPDFSHISLFSFYFVTPNFKEEDGGTSLTEIARLVNNLRAEGIHFRVESIRRLKEIAATFGPERTRTEIIPFLRDTVDMD